MDQLWWYVTRSSGIIAWLAATAAVVIGLIAATRRSRAAARRRWWVDLHQGFAALACLFAGLHVVAILADGFVDLTVADVLIPLWGAGGDIGLAAGVIGLYVLIAVEVTSVAMPRLPRWAWRAVHETSFAVFALGTAHAALIGTDTTNPVLRWLGIAGIALVTALVIQRLSGLARSWRLVIDKSTT
jgi:DMSO/TMAO reductase YedYZ heme-binding membrane subunit